MTTHSRSRTCERNQLDIFFKDRKFQPEIAPGGHPQGRISWIVLNKWLGDYASEDEERVWDQNWHGGLRIW